jgi:hypothetical protein
MAARIVRQRAVRVKPGMSARPLMSVPATTGQGTTLLEPSCFGGTGFRLPTGSGFRRDSYSGLAPTRYTNETLLIDDVFKESDSNDFRPH